MIYFKYLYILWIYVSILYSVSYNCEIWSTWGSKYFFFSANFHDIHFSVTCGDTWIEAHICSHLWDIWMLKFMMLFFRCRLFVSWTKDDLDLLEFYSCFILKFSTNRLKVHSHPRESMNVFTVHRLCFHSLLISVPLSFVLLRVSS